MTFDAAELVGYLASILVVVSLAMTSVVRLRMVSLAGSVVFIAYGLLIEAPPIVGTNVAIAALNLWFLRAELGGRRNLGATVVAAGGGCAVGPGQEQADRAHAGRRVVG